MARNDKETLTNFFNIEFLHFCNPPLEGFFHRLPTLPFFAGRDGFLQTQRITTKRLEKYYTIAPLTKRA